MNTKMFKLGSVGKNFMAVLAALVFASVFAVFSASSVFAREAESGVGSPSSASAGSSGASASGAAASPRPDDNPSAADLTNGTRVLVPEASGGNSNSGLDSARDVSERGSSATAANSPSGADSARDIFERNLAFGMMNDDGVAHLQRELTDEGFFHASATGNFLALTKKAVMEFQKEHGIPATGFVGQLTRKELNDRIKNRGASSNSGGSSGNSGASNVQLSTADSIAKQIKDLQEKVKQLQAELEKEKLAQTHQ